jgi:hypothetical protein
MWEKQPYHSPRPLNTDLDEERARSESGKRVRYNPKRYECFRPLVSLERQTVDTLLISNGDHKQAVAELGRCIG